MKKILKITACILLAAALALGALVAASEASYSSKDDPLISLSYVNKVLLPQVKEMILDTLAGVEIGDIIVTAPPVETTEEPEETTTEPVETTTVPKETEAPKPEVTFPLGTVNTGSQYVVVNLKEGESLFASVNACEVIVRSGISTVISPFTTDIIQGLSDTTDGKELLNGDAIPTNHTLIIPRDDGRGLLVGEGGAWIMVRGDFIVKAVEK